MLKLAAVLVAFAESAAAADVTVLTADRIHTMDPQRPVAEAMAWDPRLGLYAAVTREDLDGQPPGGWLADQRLTAVEALLGFTIDAAFAGFADTEVGRLAPGYPTDFVVLDGDPLTLPPRAIPGLRVHSTWIDGQPVYRAD